MATRFARGMMPTTPNSSGIIRWVGSGWKAWDPGSSTPSEIEVKIEDLRGKPLEDLAASSAARRSFRVWCGTFGFRISINDKSYRLPISEVFKRAGMVIHDHPSYSKGTRGFAPNPGDLPDGVVSQSPTWAQRHDVCLIYQGRYALPVTISQAVKIAWEMGERNTPPDTTDETPF